MSATIWTIPRESVEFIGPIVVTANGTPVTNYQIALLKEGQRPVSSDWANPIVDGADRGVMFNAGLAGSYVVWVKYTTALETVVIDNFGIIVAT